MAKTETRPTTGEVAVALTKELGAPVTERALNNILRGWVHTSRPPVVGRFRRWSPDHVERARQHLEARRLARTA